MQITLTRILIQSSTTEHVLGMEAFISRLLSFPSCHPSISCCIFLSNESLCVENTSKIKQTTTTQMQIAYNEHCLF